MPDVRWQLNAKCRSMRPEQFDVDNLTPGRERLEAQILCAGCPVIPDCARAAMASMNVSELIREAFDADLDEFDDLVPVSGVVRAGVIIPEFQSTAGA